MGVQNTNFSDPTSAMLSLQPPGTSGDPYSNMVGFKPMKQGEGDYTSPDYQAVLLEQMGMASFKDTMSSAADPNATLGVIAGYLEGLSIGMQIAKGNLSPEQLTQDQVDSINPALPFAPIVMKYVKIADDELKSGNLAGVSMSLYLGKQETAPASGDRISVSSTSATTAAAAGAIDKTVINPWLGGNAYTAFVTNFFALLMMLKEMKAVDGAIEVQALKDTVALSKETQAAIIKSAKESSMMHMLQAVIAGVTMGVTLGLTAVSVFKTSQLVPEMKGDLYPVKGADGMIKKNPDGSTMMQKDGAFDEDGNSMSEAAAKTHNAKLAGGWLGATTIQQGLLPASQSGGKATDSMIQSMLEGKVAEQEGLKEVLRAYAQVKQHQMETATEGFKSETEMINQIVQQVDQMRQKLYEAIAAAMRK